MIGTFKQAVARAHRGEALEPATQERDQVLEQPMEQEGTVTPGFYLSRGKRALDLGLSVAATPVSLAAIAMAAPFIKFDDGGPVMYRSSRVGLNGETFTMLKLRTMRVGAPDLRNFDGSTVSVLNDARLTRVGTFLRRSSLDEVPQIWNVLTGDMSFVGPRPDLPSQVSYYDSHSKVKLEVRPGITGYNQAYFRNSIPWQERLAHDAYYARHVSLRFDARILLKTVVSLLSPSGVAKVHQPGSRVSAHAS